jgi:predicted nucleotidyltransferase
MRLSGGDGTMTDVTHVTDLPLTEDLLHEIRRRIVHALTPERVIPFGSYARNRATRDSDLDLLVVTDQPINREEQWKRIRDLFRDIPLSVQVITITRQEFEETQDVIGGIAYPATKYGSVIYEKP